MKLKRTKLELTKSIIRWVVGTSVGMTVRSIIANNVDPEKPHQKVEAYVGGAVLGSMAAEASRTYIDRQVDEVVTSWNEMKAKYKEVEEEAKKEEE